MKNSLIIAALAATTLSASVNAGQIYITEYMYKGEGAEFVELTNLSNSEVDFTGWSYDDESALAGEFDLSGFGVVAAGESVIFTEATAADFIADWNLTSDSKVLGGVENNLGGSDQINIFDNNQQLVDVLTYDKDILKTKGTSGVPMSLMALGANDISQWQLSIAGDMHGAYVSNAGDLGSPGSFNTSEVPVPAAAWLFGSALMALVSLKRKSFK